ncbi:MAG: hypothetical protein J6X94_06840, partial [Lachnospiraceae bacterium]|nr:hypothetical protein [Lachnospiraceae bacterium]
EDIDSFFSELFDASVSESGRKVWADSAEEAVSNDPLQIHGSKAFWIISGVFVIIFIIAFLMFAR